MKQLLFVFLLNVGHFAFAQDTTWLQRDLEMFNVADGMDTYASAIEYLAPRIAQRRTAGPITSQLVENYRNIALWYNTDNYGNIPNPVAALKYLDTVHLLQEQIRTVPISNQARAAFLQADILDELELLGPSQYWHDRALSIMQKALAEGDSLYAGGNQKRIQFYYSEAGMAAAMNQDFRRSDLLTSAFFELNQRYRDSLGTDQSNVQLLINLMVRGYTAIHEPTLSVLPS